MSFLNDLSNPISPGASREEQYKFDNSVHDNLVALQYVMNPSVITNADFSTGGVVKTQADGDNAEFFTGWKVVGAAVANYTLSPASYAANSTIQTASTTYSHVAVSGYTTSGLYFYQRQAGTVRKYQNNFLTYGFIVYNNQSQVITVQAQIYFYYDTGSALVTRGTIYLQPGLNKITATLNTPSLSSVSVGASPYTEFRLAFINFPDGTANLDFYQIKCEFGTVSTLLNQEN